LQNSEKQKTPRETKNVKNRHIIKLEIGEDEGRKLTREYKGKLLRSPNKGGKGVILGFPRKNLAVWAREWAEK